MAKQTQIERPQQTGHREEVTEISEREKQIAEQRAESRNSEVDDLMRESDEVVDHINEVLILNSIGFIALQAA